MLTLNPGADASRTVLTAALLTRAGISRIIRSGTHRPLIPVCAGFVLGSQLITSSISATLIAAALAATIGIALLAMFSSTRSESLAILAGLALIGLGFGGMRANLVRFQLEVNPLVAMLSREHIPSAGLPAYLCGEVATPLHPTRRGGWLLLNVRSFAPGNSREAPRTAEITPRVFVSLPSQALAGMSAAPQEGDSLRVEGLLSLATAFKPTASLEGWSDWLRTQDVAASLVVKPNRGDVALVPQRWPTFTTFAPRIADRFHVWCDQRLRISLPPSLAALCGGILLGDRSSLTPSQTSAFAIAGCAHLLATAGLHVGILALMLELLLRLLTVARKLSAISIIAVVWLYALAAGDRAAVARAACVATLYYGAILLERAPDLLSSLSLCALLMLWANPLLAQDAGFQLSFGTVLGLIGVMPVLMQQTEGLLSKIANPKARRLAHRLIEIECLAVAAQAISAPLVAAHFNQVSLFGVFANLVVCPLMFLIMPAALLGFIAAVLSAPMGVISLRYLLAPLVQALFTVISCAARLGCSLAVATPSVLAITLYYVFLFAGCIWLRTLKPHEAASARNSTVGNAAALSGAAPAGSSLATEQTPR